MIQESVAKEPLLDSDARGGKLAAKIVKPCTSVVISSKKFEISVFSKFIQQYGNQFKI